MARLASALGLILAATTAVAFCPSQSAIVSRPNNALPRLGAVEGTDFDAPVLRNPQTGTAVLEREPIVDDECYMGKEGAADECVDFDPAPPRLTRSMNAHDRPRSTPRWTVADDFDAPMPAHPMSGTAILANLPIVDDECYMGKEGAADECVDFDPYSPRRTTRSMNAHDRPRSTPRWTIADDDDFDAPMPAYPMSGTAILANLPIVDDECYMGKEGAADECVDFDPYSPRRTTRSMNAHDRPRSSPRWASFLSRSGLPETIY